MKTILKGADLAVPDGVTVTIKTRKVNCSGPRGKLYLDLSHLPIDLKVSEDGKKVVVERWFTSGKQAASIRTACTHITNMIIGVTKGFKYKMRFVYSHFPINVAITNKDSRVEIRNFLGEKVVRVVDALPGVKVSRSSDVKDEIVLEGNDIQHVSRTCALVQQICVSSGRTCVSSLTASTCPRRATSPPTKYTLRVRDAAEVGMRSGRAHRR